MPLTVNEGAMIGAGMMCVSAASMFYRQKRTTPFKIAYFLSWPTLGSAIIYAFSPDKQEMEKTLQMSGYDVQKTEEDSRKRTQMQLEQLKQAAQNSNMPWGDAIVKPGLEPKSKS